MADLTPQQLTALIGAARGIDRRELATSMGVSTDTVRGHLSIAAAKLGARNTVHAVALACLSGVIKRGMVDQSSDRRGS